LAPRFHEYDESGDDDSDGSEIHAYVEECADLLSDLGADEIDADE
jgi:hypothetical protein